MFKPEAGQSPQKYRAGIAPGKTCMRETASSEIAMILGLTNVPPTGWITHDGQSGSAQFFKREMRNGQDAMKPPYNLRINPQTKAPERLPDAIAEDWQLIDDLLMHGDRHPGNYMVRLNERNEILEVVLIDNGHCLPAHPGVVAKRFPGPWEGKPVSPLHQVRLRRLIENQPDIEQRLSRTLEPEAISGLFARAKALLARGKYGNFDLTEINAHLPKDQQLDLEVPFNDISQ